MINRLTLYFYTNSNVNTNNSFYDSYLCSVMIEFYELITDDNVSRNMQKYCSILCWLIVNNRKFYGSILNAKQEWICGYSQENDHNLIHFNKIDLRIWWYLIGEFTVKKQDKLNIRKFSKTTTVFQSFPFNIERAVS